MQNFLCAYQLRVKTTTSPMGLYVLYYQQRRYYIERGELVFTVMLFIEELARKIKKMKKKMKHHLNDRH